MSKPITRTVSVPVIFSDVPSSLYCGLRMNWINGTAGKGKRKTEIDLACGAGVGQPWLIFTKSKGGKTVKTLVADMREVVKQLDKVK